MTKDEDEIVELRKRIEVLERKVLFVAPLPEPAPEPEPVMQLICTGIPRRNEEYGRMTLKSAVVKGTEVVIPDLIQDDAGKDGPVVWGGRQNDVTEFPPDALKALLNVGAEMALRITTGTDHTTERIRTIEQLEAALEKARPKEGVSA